MRLDVNEAQQVISATLAVADGTMQLGVFAAPRNEGIWDEVRAEIAESLNAQRKSSAKEVDGPFGVELHGTLPADSGSGTVPVRFIGVDGPRWFLRALVAGPVAADGARAAVLEQALRSVVVVRGTEPLPVREPVPLQLPSDLELPGRNNRRRRPGLAYAERMGKGQSLLHRLTASAENLDAAELREEIKQHSCVPMQELRRGTCVQVVGPAACGRLHARARPFPRSRPSCSTAPTRIDLVWLGRRRIAGVEPGRRVVARGRVGEHNGRKAIYNPWYELLPAWRMTEELGSARIGPSWTCERPSASRRSPASVAGAAR